MSINLFLDDALEQRDCRLLALEFAEEFYIREKLLEGLKECYPEMTDGRLIEAIEVNRRENSL